MSEIAEGAEKTTENNVKRKPGFQKGVSGNPAGRPKGSLSAGITALTQEFLSGDDNGRTRAERILDAMYEKARSGDAQAARLVMDRGYGQATAHQDLTVSVDPRETAFGKWLKEFGGAPAKPEAK